MWWKRWTGRNHNKFSRHAGYGNNGWTDHTKCELCTLHTAPRTFHRRKQFLACGSRLEQSHLLSCAFLKQSSSRTHVMFRTLPDPAPFSLQHDTPASSSLLYPPNRTNPCAPRPELLFGPFAEQSPLPGYEPNALVEVSSAEVMTTLLPSRKTNIGST